MNKPFFDHVLVYLGIMMAMLVCVYILSMRTYQYEIDRMRTLEAVEWKMARMKDAEDVRVQYCRVSGGDMMVREETDELGMKITVIDGREVAMGESIVCYID